MTPGRSLCVGSRDSQPLSASKSKVNMTATRAPLGQGEVMRVPPEPAAECAHRTRSGWTLATSVPTAPPQGASEEIEEADQSRGLGSVYRSVSIATRQPVVAGSTRTIEP